MTRLSRPWADIPSSEHDGKGWAESSVADTISTLLFSVQFSARLLLCVLQKLVVDSLIVCFCSVRQHTSQQLCTYTCEDQPVQSKQHTS